MNLSRTLMAQVAVLLATVTAGAVLSGNLADGPREVHRFMGLLAGILAAATLVQAFITKASPKIIGLLVVALTFTFFAALAGSSLKTTSDYQSAFTNMRLSGVVALITAGIALVLLLRKPPAKAE